MRSEKQKADLASIFVSSCDCKVDAHISLLIYQIVFTP